MPPFSPWSPQNPLSPTPQTQFDSSQFTSGSETQQSSQSDVDMNEDQSESLQSPTHTNAETTSRSCKGVKLFWTPEMERAALELYVQAVRQGKQSGNGFKPETHRAIAVALQVKFPNVDLDEKKVKSKYNQGFKKDYDVFFELKNQSGFGWNDTTMEVTAPDQVWSSYLMSHPQARKFKGKPFPDWFYLVEIFEKVVATGVNSFSSLSAQPQSLPAPESPSINIETTWNRSSMAGTAPEPDESSPRIHCTAGRVSTGVQIAGALSELISLNQPSSRQTQGARAMEFFQSTNADEFDDLEQLSIINVFYSERRAALYMSIHQKDLQLGWLRKQI